MLSFKEEEIIDSKPTRIEEPKIDIIKLMRYTKRGNKKWFQEELLKKSANRLSAIQLRSKSISKMYNKNNNNKLFEKEKENSDENNMIDFFNFKPNTFSNFKNTIKTVKNEAEKSYFLQENFIKKKDTMDELFNNKILPKIEDYDYLIQKNVKRKPTIRKNVDIDKTNEEDGENKKKKEKKKDVLRHEINSFSKKKLTWTKEDFLREQSKKKDKDVLEETKKYLKEVKEVQKKANKEESINQCINIFNKYLSEHNDFYNKKNNINNKKPIKKIINKNLIELQNKKEEEKKKKKEEERINYLELLEKMRENLEKEEDEEDIQLNFQYKLYKGFVKETNLALNAYNDYLELLEIAKERKLKGDYDYNNMVENKDLKKKQKENAYTKFVKNFSKLNTYINEDGKLVKYDNPLTMFNKKISGSSYK